MKRFLKDFDNALASVTNYQSSIKPKRLDFPSLKKILKSMGMVTGKE